MIRNVKDDDCHAIAEIYNEYVVNSTASFETDPVTAEEMLRRINTIYPAFPYFVYEKDGRILGYCYAHPWKERAAYSKTLETTVYIADKFRGKGLGKALIGRLIDECRHRGYEVLVACVTAENKASREMHLKMGFKQASLFERVGIKFGRHLDVVDFSLHLTN